MSRGGSESANSGVEYTQVTSRIHALTFPTSGSDSVYRSSIKEISERLRKTYPDRYKIFNVSQKRSDLGRANAGTVVELGWPDQLAPPLDRLCSICKQIENWLNANPENVVIIHCKGWRSRAAVVIAAYMHYTTICTSESTKEDRFSMQLFSEKFLGTDGHPSHRRYVGYFANLLAGSTRVNPTPIFLTHVKLARLPGRVVVLKIYERMKPVSSTEPTLLDDASRVEFDDNLSLRGDVLVKCFEKTSADPPQDRVLLFQCQFNTCALNLSSSSASLTFYKDELDLVSPAGGIDTQASIEFYFILDAPQETRSNARRSASAGSSRQPLPNDFGRADSYENFDRPEDDRSLSLPVADPPPTPLYSEINKPLTQHQQSQSSTSTGTTITTTTTDGADSGIGSDSPRARTEVKMPPQVPPKPRRNSYTGSYGEVEPEREDTMRSGLDDDDEKYVGREHSVLPASVRPVTSRPSTPGSVSIVSRTEPDLVSRDRYDPKSKCFSYVPAKSLNEHYSQPKKPPPRRPSVDRSNIDIPEAVATESLKGLKISASDLRRRAETPKWDTEIDKIVGELPPLDSPKERRHSTDWIPDYRSLPAESSSRNSTTKTLPNGYLPSSPQTKTYSRGQYQEDAEIAEKPLVVDLAKKAVKSEAPRSKRRPRYGSYNNLDDEYASDMDELLDPEYYLSGSAAPTPTPEQQQRKQLPPQRHSAIPFERSKGITTTPRPPPRSVSQRELDQLNDLLESTTATAKPPPRSSGSQTPKPQGSLRDREDFRSRNCRSVNSHLYNKEKKLFAHDSYDAAEDADNPDDWLTKKLRTLQSKRHMDPDFVKRRQTEKLLLEELKNANSERELSGKKEAEHITEGVGRADPLEEYRREEERLRNTASPYINELRAANRSQTDHTFRPMNGISQTMPSPARREGWNQSPAPQYRRGATPTGRIVREKPPTPPPSRDRDRSRSPARSSPAVSAQRRQLQQQSESPAPRTETQLQRSIYQQQRDRLVNSEYLSDDEEHSGGEFGNLKRLVKEGRAQTVGPTGRETPSTKSILKRRQTSPSVSEIENYAPMTQSDIYSSPVAGRRRLNEGVASTRSETPNQESLPQRRGIAPSPAQLSQVQPPATPTLRDRAETPAFPVSRETPLPYHPLLYSSGANEEPAADNGMYRSNALTQRNDSPRSMYYGQSRRSSMTSVDAGEVIHHHPVFVKDTSKYWYKPTISREEAINMLRHKTAGTFVVRDSSSFPGAFGLALKVAQAPPGVTPGDGTELVRHFLIEPSPKGVKLKGCNNEPVFGTLAALVYQHSITPLALPCRLILPEYDPATTPEHVNGNLSLLDRGAACNVTYICSLDTESLTGPEAVRRAVAYGLELHNRGQLRAVPVHFKVSSQGITLTDNTRSLFFRRHYQVNAVTYSGIDPEDRRFDNNLLEKRPDTYIRQAPMFAFVARKYATGCDNACHVFAELDPDQPASAVVRFITNVMMPQARASQQQLHQKQG